MTQQRCERLHATPLTFGMAAPLASMHSCKSFNRLTVSIDTEQIIAIAGAVEDSVRTRAPAALQIGLQPATSLLTQSALFGETA